MVIKGPVAMAGSILNRSRVKGTRVPENGGKNHYGKQGKRYGYRSRYIVEEKPVVNEYE